VWSRSIIHLHGLVGPVTWTNLAQTAFAGDMRVIVKDAVRDDNAGWNIGDTVVIASTDYRASNLAPEQSEVRRRYPRRCLLPRFDDDACGLAQTRTIVAISADKKTVWLNAPLMYTHWGADGMFAGESRACELSLSTRRSMHASLIRRRCC
jgi:hypothetical protein